LVNVRFREAPKTLSSFLIERESGFPFAEFALLGSGIAQIAPGDHRSAGNDEVGFSLVFTAGRFEDLRVQGKNAAIAETCLLLVGEGTILYFIEFEQRSLADDLFDTGRIVDTRQLNQQLAVSIGAATRLNSGFSQSQRVDTAFNRRHGTG